MTHQVIYIPGLGDHRARAQAFAVKLWRLQGVQSEVVRMHWRDGKPFAPKLAALVKKIDAYHAQGDDVSLVAASAGASAAVAAFAARPQHICGVVLVCGKVRNPQNMRPSVFRQNVSFRDSMGMIGQSLAGLTADARRRIMTIHPLADESVPVTDTTVQGAVDRTMPVAGHAFSIGVAITVYAPVILGFLKSLAKLR